MNRTIFPYTLYHVTVKTFTNVARFGQIADFTPFRIFDNTNVSAPTRVFVLVPNRLKMHVVFEIAAKLVFTRGLILSQYIF